jgi:formyl-CoA transferase
MAGPLDGIKVVDFTEIIAGPLAGRLLADLGAEVIKVEPPWGDPWRFTQAFTSTESRNFMVYNSGKRSLPLDLTKDAAKEILSRLVVQADVALVNYRPDVAAKLGVDYEALSLLNPKLVYCELTAFGRQGPDAHRPGYDMIIQAMTGMVASETKTVDGAPSWIWSSPLVDTSAGLCIAGSVCAALFARERTGRGQKIETSLLASALTLMGGRFLQVESLDKEMRVKTRKDLQDQRAAGASYDELVESSPGSRRKQYHGDIYYRIYMTADGPIGVGCLSNTLRRRLLETLGITDKALEPGWNPNLPESLAHGRDLKRQAESLFLEKNSEEWLELLESKGIPAGPMRFIEELFGDPQVLANGLVTEVVHSQEGPVKMVGPMAHFGGTPLPPTRPSPALGEHSAEVLRGLGFTQSDIDSWKESGVVG